MIHGQNRRRGLHDGSMRESWYTSDSVYRSIQYFGKWAQMKSCHLQVIYLWVCKAWLVIESPFLTTQQRFKGFSENSSLGSPFLHIPAIELLFHTCTSSLSDQWLLLLGTKKHIGGDRRKFNTFLFRRVAILTFISSGKRREQRHTFIHQFGAIGDIYRIKGENPKVLQLLNLS